jgi:hypothetical protein
MFMSVSRNPARQQKKKMLQTHFLFRFAKDTPQLSFCTTFDPIQFYLLRESQKACPF